MLVTVAYNVVVRAFHYRSFPTAFLALFFYVWSIPWLIGIIVSWNTGNVTLNDKPATPEQARLLLSFAAVVGVLVFAAGTRLMMTVLFERIVIDGDQVRWIDWRGRERTSAYLSTLGELEETVSSKGGRTASVSAPDGEIRFSTGISDYAELKSFLTRRSTEDLPLPSNPGALARAVGPERVYRYWGSYLHLFSFLWLGATTYVIWKPSLAAVQGQPFQNGSPWPFVIIGSLFGLVGVWMQLTGWVERISLGPGGIRWVDWKGTVRVDAGLDEIIDFEWTSEPWTISTRRGAITFNSYLRGGGQLASSIKALLRERDSQGL